MGHINRESINTSLVVKQGFRGLGNSLSKGLEVENVSASVVRVRGELVSVQGVTLSNFNFQATITGNGVGGLDEGLEKSNAWYAIYLIAGYEQAGIILSESSSAPVLPEGYFWYRKVGWARNQANDFVPFYKTGKDFIYREIQYAYSKPGFTTGGMALLLSFSQWVPPGCEEALFAWRSSITNSDIWIATRPNSSYFWTQKSWLYCTTISPEGGVCSGGQYHGEMTNFRNGLDDRRLDFKMGGGWTNLSKGDLYVVGYTV